MRTISTATLLIESSRLFVQCYLPSSVTVFMGTGMEGDRHDINSKFYHATIVECIYLWGINVLLF